MSHTRVLLLKRPPPLLAGLAGAAGAGLGAYWWLTYAGLYRWLAEGQLQLLAVYEPIWTGILLCLALAGAGVGLLLLVLRLVAPSFLNEQAAAPGADQMEAIQRFLRQSMALLVGLGLGVFGLVQVIVALGMGDKGPLDLRALEAAEEPATRWVEVSARLLDSNGYGVSESGRTTWYLPLVTEGWERERGVALFVEIDDEALRNLDSEKLHGTLHRNGLPGIVRTYYEAQGPRPAAIHWVLDDHNTPGKTRGLGLVLLAVGAVIGGIGGVVAWRTRRKESQAAEPFGHK